MSIALAKRQRLTTLLAGVREGNAAAREELFRFAYDELRDIAAAYMHQERPGHTLQPTALVHEAVLRLGGDLTDIEGSVHFFAVAARAMRRILVDHARHKNMQKRRANHTPLPPDDALVDRCNGTPAFLVDLDEALQRLADIAPRHGEVFELWYFGGLSTQELAEQFSTSQRTVQAELQAARTWLYGHLYGER